MNFNAKYEETKKYFEEKLYSLIDNLSISDETLKTAMAYSVKAGGKRFRPVLMIETAKMLEVNIEDIMPFALAIELIHTYSLIHDDLPCMDNDDFRRGKPTSHKVFGEALAVLAGDALLNLAYETMLRGIGGIYKVNASRLLSRFAGYQGMIGGQATDVLSEGKALDEETLNYIHQNKTGKLITAAVLVASCVSGDKYINELRTYGENIGLLFQITDDILDALSTSNELGKTVGKDEKAKKLTFVTLYGIEKSKQMAQDCLNNAINAISDVDDNEFLIELAKYILDRKS
ncbi:MAG: polyprenyl synthetase family protein [Clostridia bacterium]|nr:polyprenyl synthetase family protein [Clostridia bacterium]